MPGKGHRIGSGKGQLVVTFNKKITIINLQLSVEQEVERATSSIKELLQNIAKAKTEEAVGKLEKQLEAATVLLEQAASALAKEMELSGDLSDSGADIEGAI